MSLSLSLRNPRKSWKKMAGVVDDSFAYALPKHNDPIFWGGKDLL